MAKYQVRDDGDMRKYYTQVPNIVDDSDLSVYAFRLYVHLKRVAGDDGMCTQSTRTLATSCKMSMGAVAKAKKELEQVRFIAVKTIPGQHGEFASHEIVITDIWNENMAKYSTCSRGEQELFTQETGPYHEVKRTVSPRETKNNPVKKEPIKKEQGAPVFPAGLDTPEFRDAWEEYSEHRREKGKPLTHTAQARVFKTLEPYGAEVAALMLGQSVENNWLGVFPLKQSGGAPSNGRAGHTAIDPVTGRVIA